MSVRLPARLPCVLCGRPSELVVLCCACLARVCECGHPAGDHDTRGNHCLAFPACACGRLEVVVS